jgi:protocatechuate 3,4-dioxygenase beta subunit
MGAVVNLWHTDAAGDYGTEDVECCYYQGSVSTDRNGLFRLATVRPGQYNQANAPPQHIHVEISHLSGRLMWFADDPSVPARPPGDVIVLALRKIDSGSTDRTSWQGAATFILGA